MTKSTSNTFFLCCVFFALSLVLSGYSDSTAFCFCEMPTLDEAFAKHDIVFYGRVLKFELKNYFESKAADMRLDLPVRGDEYRIATVQIQKIWKGKPDSVLEVSTNSGGGSCGIPFVAGEYYLVLANKTGTMFWTWTCTRTAPGIYAQNDIEELEKKHPREKQ